MSQEEARHSSSDTPRLTPRDFASSGVSLPAGQPEYAWTSQTGTPEALRRRPTPNGTLVVGGPNDDD